MNEDLNKLQISIIYDQKVANSATNNTNGFKNFIHHLRKIESFPNTPPEKRDDCIVVICALPDELQNAIEAFGGNEDLPLKKDAFKEHAFSYKSLEYQNYKIVFIVQNQQGMVSAASLTARAIVNFKPKLVAMTGICAGQKKKAKLGDLIIVKQTFDYEAGKKVEEDGSGGVATNHRPQTIQLEPKIINIITNMFTSKVPERVLELVQQEKHFRIPASMKFNIHFKPLASGSCVVSDGGQTLQEIAHQQEDLAGIDMEAYGIAYSARTLSTKWVVIKGIQDFADSKKGKHEKTYRQFGQYASARLLRYFLDSPDFRATLDMN